MVVALCVTTVVGRCWCPTVSVHRLRPNGGGGRTRSRSRADAGCSRGSRAALSRYNYCVPATISSGPNAVRPMRIVYHAIQYHIWHNIEVGSLVFLGVSVACTGWNSLVTIMHILGD